MPHPFFLTTPIYYVNARPHIGHAYTTIVADVLARRARAEGRETFFLTGTDEHGQKIERSAAAAGIPPQAFADEVSASFRTLWQRMGITNDAYIRTTDAAHKRGVQKLFADLHAAGHIYLSSYTGQYSIGEEMFVEGPPGTLGPDGKPTETVTEENFFFRLSDYQLPLLNLIEDGPNGEPPVLKITPESRRNEVLSFLRGNMMGAFSSTAVRESVTKVTAEGGVAEVGENLLQPAFEAGHLSKSQSGKYYVPGTLKDLSVSRSSFTWGIPVPEPAASEAREAHVIYVWLDALANYMTALGYGSENTELFDKFWPADLHLVGKEIIRFHCVYWPAFLLALNPKLRRTATGETPILPPQDHAEWAAKWLPRAVTAHGWLLFEDSKMSKSKGNIVRTETILDTLGPLHPPIPPGGEARVPHPLDSLTGDRVGPTSAASPATDAAALASRYPEASASGLSSPPAEGALAPGSSPTSSSADALGAPSFAPLAKGGVSSEARPPSPIPPQSPTEQEPSTRHASLMGTASAVPLASPTHDAALAPGVSPTSSSADALRAPSFAPLAKGGVSSEARPSSPNPPQSPTEQEQSTRHASLKGTASAVPLATSKNEAALAAEVRPPSKHHQDLFAADILRYFLLREIPFGQDGTFSFDALITRYNADLANGYGNLVSRTLSMIKMYFDGEVPEPSVAIDDLDFQELIPALMATESSRAFFYHPNTLRSNQRVFLDLIRRAYSDPAAPVLLNLLHSIPLSVDTVLSAAQPWKKSLSSIGEATVVRDVLYFAAESIRLYTAAMHPILPYATANVWRQLGLGDIEQAAATGQLTDLKWGGLSPGTRLGPLSPIFPRADKGLAQIMTDLEATKTSLAAELFQSPAEHHAPTDPAAGPRTATFTEPSPGLQVAGSTAATTERTGTPPHSEANPSGIFANEIKPDQTPQITIDDFAKIELRVAQILVAERIPKADKLLRLEVDLGPAFPARRQILSGIAEWYTPEDLVGRRIIVITNLAPRKMRGLESHGMLLAGSPDATSKPILATMADDLPLGTRLK